MHLAPWYIVLVISLVVRGRRSECIIEENSRVFVPVCDIMKLFPKIEAPKIDNFRNLFRLSGTNLELIQNLDREKLIANQRCDMNKLSSYNSNGQCVLILDLSGAGPIFNQLSVVVTDVNDNVPTFDRSNFHIKIPENSQSNLEVDLPQARDPDRGRNGTVMYSLQKSAASHKFVLLNPSSSGALDSPLKLKVLKSFDREQEESSIHLTLVAKDLGNPSLSSSLTIKIEITDVNDHAPEFNQSSYRFNIPESILPAQVIGRVMATDRDASNQTVIMISPSASSQIMDLFTVASDGSISTKLPLQYTSSSYDYRLPIIAVDLGSPPLTATTTVFIHVTDVNDNSPTIEVTSSNLHNRFFLMENCPPNTYIAKVTAKDNDYGANGIVECKIDGNYLFVLELIQNFDNKLYYKLVTAPLSTFDRESKDTHHISIVCYDKGTPPQTTTRAITVLVKDENDNPPVFPVQYLTERIKENQPIGSRLVTVKAVDKDIGINRQTKYRLAEENLSQFTIDSYTGVITTMVKFDREITNQVTVRATAFDFQLPHLQSNLTIHVTILDENDNKPVFKDIQTPFHVMENKEGFIGRILASDSDEGINSDLEFFLMGQSDTFQVTKTGDLLVNKKATLDRERSDHYSIEIGVRDKGRPPLTSSTTVEVTVDDMNDCRPKFTHPPQGGYRINISISTPQHTKVYTAQAQDNDAGINSRLVYSIRPQGLFVINSSNGAIYLNRTLSSDIDLPHILTIYAQDCGTPSLTGTSSLLLKYDQSGLTNHPQQDTKPDSRLSPSSSRDLVLSLGIGMVLLIFTCLMMLVTYFCVTIFIQKRRQKAENSNKERCVTESRSYHWMCGCLPRTGDDNLCNDQSMTDKERQIPLHPSMDREQHYRMCLNRWDNPRSMLGYLRGPECNPCTEEDPLYSYREFTMKPVMSGSDSPLIYDRLSTLPQSANPYWQYNTLGHISHRPSYPSDIIQDNHNLPPQQVIYHPHHTPSTYLPKLSHHPDLINSNSSDEVNRIIYGEMSPASMQSTMKLSLFSQPNYDNDKQKYDSDHNFPSMEMMEPSDNLEDQSRARFAGYVVGSPCYANSFV